MEDRPWIPVRESVELLRGNILVGTRDNQALYSSEVNTDGVLEIRSGKKKIDENIECPLSSVP